MNYWVEQNIKKCKLFKIGDSVYWRRSKYLNSWSKIIQNYGPHPMFVEEIFWSFYHNQYCLTLRREGEGGLITEVLTESVCLVPLDFVAFV